MKRFERRLNSSSSRVDLLFGLEDGASHCQTFGQESSVKKGFHAPGIKLHPARLVSEGWGVEIGAVAREAEEEGSERRALEPEDNALPKLDFR